jgi:hypothetical protein
MQCYVLSGIDVDTLAPVSSWPAQGRNMSGHMKGPSTILLSDISIVVDGRHEAGQDAGDRPRVTIQSGWCYR